jgi:hypothetical protein
VSGAARVSRKPLVESMAVLGLSLYLVGVLLMVTVELIVALVKAAF